jgi:hypothetical protein
VCTFWSTGAMTPLCHRAHKRDSAIGQRPSGDRSGRAHRYLVLSRSCISVCTFWATGAKAPNLRKNTPPPNQPPTSSSAPQPNQGSHPPSEVPPPSHHLEPPRVGCAPLQPLHDLVDIPRHAVRQLLLHHLRRITNSGDRAPQSPFSSRRIRSDGDKENRG